MKSFYDTLGVLPSSSLDQIKAAYRAKLLMLHPDKQQQHGVDGDLRGSSSTGAAEIKAVQQAYDVLKDAAKRAAHDKALEVHRTQSDVHPWDSLPVADLEEAEDGLHLMYECRCGDVFHVPRAEAEQLGSSGVRTVLVECSTCGNVLEVTS